MRLDFTLWLRIILLYLWMKAPRVSKESLYFNRKTIACPCELLNSSPVHCLWSIIYLSVSKIILLPTCTFYMNCQFLSNLNFLQFPSISDSRSTDWCFQIFSHTPDLASLRTKICPDLYWDSVVFHSWPVPPGPEVVLRTEAGWLEVYTRADHVRADFMPEVAALLWATQEVHRNCCIFHSLLQKTQTSLMFLSSPKTFRVQIRKCTALPLNLFNYVSFGLQN